MPAPRPPKSFPKRRRSSRSAGRRGAAARAAPRVPKPCRSRPSSSSRAPAVEPRLREPARRRKLARRRRVHRLRRRAAARRERGRHERAAEKQYLTFSIDDVAPPRPAAEPEQAQHLRWRRRPDRRADRRPAGQARTKIGRKVAELCNALTGGFVAFLGFGSFCARVARQRARAACFRRCARPTST